MGKPNWKKKQHASGNTGDAKRKRPLDATSKLFDKDITIFIIMSREYKEEGNRLFQKRDHEGALLQYDKALKLLPKSHIDVAYLHTYMATCFMQMVPGEYNKAIIECNLALEVSPKFCKALLKRARCYEALNMLELAFKDINAVLLSEPNNFTAQDIAQRIRKELESKGVNTTEILTDSEHVISPCCSPQCSRAKSKAKNKDTKSDVNVSGIEDKIFRSNSKNSKEQTLRNVKLVVGEDIRWAQIPSKCSVIELREIVRNRFPSLKGILIKYKDNEGDLVTITSTEELRWAETSSDPSGSVRLYVVEVSPEKEPFFEENSVLDAEKLDSRLNGIVESRYTRQRVETEPVCIEDWIVQFARLFKNHVGFNTDPCLDLHEFGMKLYAEAMEDAVTCEEAQELLDLAANKFQEMTALALFNWGNVHMSRARKKVFFSEEASRESIIERVKTTYEWAEREYVKAGEKYKESLRFKSDFYEGIFALGQQQFEQAKLSWYFAVANKANLETLTSEGLLDLFDSVEECITKGSEIWEVVEAQRMNDLSKLDQRKLLLKKMGLDGLIKDTSQEEAAEHFATMQSQINILWGTVLYERSLIEFKLGVQFWKDTLETAIERFEEGGISEIDTAVMRKNHCSNSVAHEGLGYDIDEIVQALHEMSDANRWMSGIPCFRLEPLLRCRFANLKLVLEHV